MKKPILLSLVGCSIFSGFGLLPGFADPIPVEVVESHGMHILLRDGKPYFVKGAGGFTELELLARIGGNSIRTWGSDATEALLDEAHDLGLSVCVGIWITHERHGFDYSDDAAVAEQIRQHCAVIDQFKDHPAVLMWGIGNEVELQAENPRVWDVIEAVAAYAKKVDPHHPTMTVIAQAPLEVVELIHERCPSIDILGCNSYGGISVLAEEVAASGWDKPYMLTEWGTNGPWESDTTAWGAEIEFSTTAKAIEATMRHGLFEMDRANCLGGYVFHWGWKQENTPTWFSLFLEDGRKTETIAALGYLWSGKDYTSAFPRIANLRINGERPSANVTLKKGRRAKADFQLLAGELEDLDVVWEILPESTEKGFGGDPEDQPDPIDIKILKRRGTGISFVAPKQSGPYRLFLYVNGKNETVAAANFPFLVK